MSFFKQLYSDGLMMIEAFLLSIHSWIETERNTHVLSCLHVLVRQRILTVPAGAIWLPNFVVVIIGLKQIFLNFLRDVGQVR